jgi:ribosomal protein L29
MCCSALTPTDERVHALRITLAALRMQEVFTGHGKYALTRRHARTLARWHTVNLKVPRER